MYERFIERLSFDNSIAIREHTEECEGIKLINNLIVMNKSLDAGIKIPGVYHRNININAVRNSVQIIDSHENWFVLLYREGLKTKKLKPILNKNLKELDLF